MSAFVTRLFLPLAEISDFTSFLVFGHFYHSFIKTLNDISALILYFCQSVASISVLHVNVVALDPPSALHNEWVSDLLKINF